MARKKKSVNNSRKGITNSTSSERTFSTGMLTLAFIETRNASGLCQQIPLKLSRTAQTDKQHQGLLHFHRRMSQVYQRANSSSPNGSQQPDYGGKHQGTRSSQRKESTNGK
ncbi:hypothetical protein TNCV_364961 [Trichonephila clavipes]|nr:hypothetical protein TNCV_364961 [Trichonephila clavipes]